VAATAQVWVRLISLEGCPEGFGTEVTRATNTQNAVENRDFVSLDPEQTRLRHEFMLVLGKLYAIKRGGPAPADDTGCSVVEAAVALACAQDDVALPVYAKANVGRLWASTEAPPYTTLFYRGISAAQVWRSVQVLRRVDGTLEQQQRLLSGRLRAIATQGNRIVAHLVFRALDRSDIDDPLSNWNSRLDAVPGLARTALVEITSTVETEFAENYVTSLFKNVSKCRYLVGDADYWQ
jgi:AIPR protein